MASYWQFGDGGLAAGNVGAAPTYNDVFTKFGGNEYMTGWDPALAMTLNAGNQGGIASGVGAFLSGRNPMQGAQYEGGSLYADDEMATLAGQMGIDTQGKTGMELQGLLDAGLGDYYQIGGMSAGWNPTGDARQGNSTLYQRKDGKLVPIQTQAGHLSEEGSWLEEHPGILAPIAVATGGLAYGALAGAGTGAAGAGVAGTTGAGTTGAGVVGTTGAGATGISGSIANALGVGGWWGGLPGWGQGAITGALQGGVSSGLQGQNILKGALMGGLTGGVGAAGGQWLSGATGLPAWASRAAVSAGLGGLSGGWQGALGGGLGSLAATGLGEMGLPSGLASRLGSLAGRAGAGALVGGSAGGAGGGSGGVGMAGGSIGAPSSAGTGATGGLSGGWRRPSAADAATASYLKASYAPIAAEAQRKRLAEELGEAL